MIDQTFRPREDGDADAKYAKGDNVRLDDGLLGKVTGVDEQRLADDGMPVYSVDIWKDDHMTPTWPVFEEWIKGKIDE